jgi:RNA polymerase sigma factor (sigma-70 family)
MNKRWTLTQESFDSLLAWLDSERDRAGRRYEEIRQTLVKMFIWRGIPEAEELADETINRVAQRLHKLKETYAGDPALYFYGVAKKILLEYLREHRQVPLVPAASTIPTPEDRPSIYEREYECLEECLGKLPPTNRELILSYYSAKKRAKVEHRKELAEKSRLGINALRVRAFRVRAALEKCVRDCLDNKKFEDPT